MVRPCATHSKRTTMVINHPIPPVFDADSKVLILGTMPSPKSRENGFFYTHPQNRFWPVLATVLGEPLPLDNAQRKALLLRRGIAMWDVLQSCEINGASDGSIRQPVANDLSVILNRSRVHTVFTTGGKATALYRKHCLPSTRIESVALPSTSPANQGRFDMAALIKEYAVIAEALKEG